MTGRRLLIQVLGWDFLDYGPSNHRKTHNHATKRWSKKGRNFLKKQLKKEIDDKN